MKTVDFSETIVVCDLKIGRCRQLIELMKVCKYYMPRSFFTMTQGHLHMKSKTCFSKISLGHFNQILYVSFSVHGNENLLS